MQLGIWLIITLHLIIRKLKNLKNISQKINYQLSQDLDSTNGLNFWSCWLFPRRPNDVQRDLMINYLKQNIISNRDFLFNGFNIFEDKSSFITFLSGNQCDSKHFTVLSKWYCVNGTTLDTTADLNWLYLVCMEWINVYYNKTDLFFYLFE